jgi:hypothetical protein
MIFSYCSYVFKQISPVLGLKYDLRGMKNLKKDYHCVIGEFFFNLILKLFLRLYLQLQITKARWTYWVSHSFLIKHNHFSYLTPILLSGMYGA